MTTQAMAHSRPILSARGIVNRFGNQLLHDKINLDIAPGEIIGIVGGSGTGKSVLLKTLIGLHQPEAGEVLINDKAVASIGAAEKAALIGVLFQQGALFSALSVAQNIMLPMREHTALPADEQALIAAMKIALAGLPVDSGSKFPAALSGGMVKRAAFARALALDPRILFLDEPTSDLDPIAASGIDALILQLNQILGITVIIVTHDITTLFTVCRRIAVLVDRTITVDTADHLMQSDHPWIHEFFHGTRGEGAMKERDTSNGN